MFGRKVCRATSDVGAPRPVGSLCAEKKLFKLRIGVPLRVGNPLHHILSIANDAFLAEFFFFFAIM